MVICHRSVVALFAATAGWGGFGARTCGRGVHSYAFDFSVWELWGALLHGGRVVVVPFEVSRSPEEFWELVVRERVTMLSQTPSAFYQLVAGGAGGGGGGWRCGRWCSVVRRWIRPGWPWWYRTASDAPMLVNMYGITETTVHVTTIRSR